MKPEILEKKKVEITEEESKEVRKFSHSVLLEEAFVVLTNKFDIQESRKKCADAILAYWQNQKMIYEKAMEERLVQEGEEYIVGEERISISYCDSYVLEIKRKTETEEDRVSIRASIKRGLEEFVLSPTISIASEIKADPEKPAEVFYKVIIKDEKINYFERKRKTSEVENIRTFNFSDF
jgi:hypothetical protein